MKHVCHAVGCEVEVKPELLCCGRHWAMVPRNLQKVSLGYLQARSV